MRRYWSVFALCGAATIISACGSAGGYGLETGGNGKIDRIVFSTNSPGANDFFITPLPESVSVGLAPLQISAVGQRGAGQFANVVPDATFVWGAAYSTGQYTTGPTPNGFKTCKVAVDTTAALANPTLYRQNPAYQLPPYPGYQPIDGSYQSNTVFVGATPGASPVGYCILVTATHPSDGVAGSVLTVVTQ